MMRTYSLLENGSVIDIKTQAQVRHWIIMMKTSINTKVRGITMTIPAGWRAFLTGLVTAAFLLLNNDCIYVFCIRAAFYSSSWSTRHPATTQLYPIQQAITIYIKWIKRWWWLHWRNSWLILEWSSAKFVCTVIHSRQLSLQLCHHHHFDELHLGRDWMLNH